MTTTPQAKDAMALQIAETVAQDMRRLIGADRKARVCTWAGSDHARVYTGAGDEHLRVYRDGRIERSRSRMTWGSQIDAMMAEDRATAMGEISA